MSKEVYTLTIASLPGSGGVYSNLFWASVSPTANGNLILQPQMPTLGLCLHPVLSQTRLRCQVIGICSRSTTVGESWGGTGGG